MKESDNNNRDENIKLIHRWIDATNAHDVELIGETLHAGYKYHFGNSEIKGKEEAMREWKLFLEGFPDMKYEVQQILADEDYVVARLRMTGTQKGVFRFVGTNSLEVPIPASNKPIDIQTCGVYKIKDGQIIWLHRYWDSATLLRQIGVTDKL